MIPLVVLIAMLGAAEPPIVGRPVDFSGAIGGPFIVQWIAEPTELIAEEPLTLTLRVTGPGRLAEIPRPALGKLESFKSFAVEDVDDRVVAGDSPRREFRYRVRPRSADVKEIPRFKFVYFNPQIVPASRGFQTTYAASVPLNARPRTQPTTSVPAEVPDWMLEPPASDELFGPPQPLWEQWIAWVSTQLGREESQSPNNGAWIVIAVAVCFPPALCWLGLIVWRRLNPDAARLSAGRRSRAAAAALRELNRAEHDPGEKVANAFLAYLRDRAGLHSTAVTTGDVATGLESLGCPADLVAATVDLFRRCDAVRFGPGPKEDAALIGDAKKKVLEWESTKWV
jgi:hypothetical protein